MEKEILIVDDDELILSNLSSVLAKDGFKILKAPNGVEAMKVIKTERPDLILLDLVMPLMDGVEFIKQVELVDPDLIPKIIVMTNAEDSAHLAEVMTHGVFIYVSKSNTDLDTIAKMVKDRLS